MRTGEYVVGPDIIVAKPTKDDLQVYCTEESADALYALRGTGAVNGDWSSLAKVRDDMLAIDQAITRYYDSANTMPPMLDALLDDDFGVTADNLVNPWGHSYHYESGLSGRTAPTYTLQSYGADNAAGGRDADADVNREDLDMLSHVLGLVGYSRLGQ